MIFNGELVTLLVLDWQTSRDKTVLAHILSESTALIEAIASSYGALDRSDLIQEAYIKVHHSIEYYDPKIAPLHSYLTTVIRNICITYVTKQDRQPTDELQLEMLGDEFYTSINDTDILSELIIRNRERFISVPVAVVDDMTEFIYYELKDDGMSRKSITKAAEMFGCSRTIVSTIYNSTIVYLRVKYIDCGKCGDDVDTEFSLLPELENVVGKDMYKYMLLVFSGMSIKIPS